MRILLRLAPLAVLAIALGAAPAHAQLPSWSLYAGYSNPTGDASLDGSLAARGNVFFQSNPVIGIGAELGYHRFGSVEVTPGENLETSMLQITPVVRARAIASPTMQPYGIAGLGLYSLRTSFMGASDSNSEFGFNLGGGVTFGGQGPVSFGVEGRWHSIQTSPRTTDVLSFMAGINFH